LQPLKNPMKENDISAGAYRGGTLNYRTGKLDDGIDPYGWYGIMGQYTYFSFGES